MLTHCCLDRFEMTVRTGSRVLSVLNTIIYVGLLALIVYSLILAKYLPTQPEANTDSLLSHAFLNAWYGLFVTLAVVWAIGCLVSISFAWGAFTGQRRYILPHLVFKGILHGIEGAIFVFIIVIAASDNSQWLFGLAGAFAFSLALGIYFFVVVLSYYKQLGLPKQTVTPPAPPQVQQTTPAPVIALREQKTVVYTLKVQETMAVHCV
ncbi:uncharacterized protein LOC115325200 [Ixodes scapularis]|uniref:uncharacterized protein LOC115325200 n=1 Tax=Ixodes scapularis TaxID=6945 RepID=UPI001A9E6016|nr:uncharacterized protein LOC115325200 [Ixodes scapularis]